MDHEINGLIDTLLANGPEATIAAKKLISDISGKPIDQAVIDYTCDLIAGIRVSNQGQEGLNAFLEKRKPQWIRD